MITDDEMIFDDSIRKKLTDDEEEAPAYVWGKINASMKRRRFAWLFRGLNTFLLHDIVIFLTVLSASGNLFAVKNNLSENSASESAEKINAVSMPSINNKNSYAVYQNEDDEKGNINATDSKMADANKFKQKPASSNEINQHKEYHSDQDMHRLQYTGNSMGTHVRDKQQSVLTDESSISATSMSGIFNDEMAMQRESIALMEMMIPTVNYNYDLMYTEVSASNKEKHKPVAIRIVAGTLWSNSNPEKKEVYNVKEKSNGLRGNKNFAIMFDYPLAGKWNVIAGIGYHVSNYSLTISRKSYESYLQTDSVTGYIISPFDPPIPFTYLDTTSVTVETLTENTGSFAIKSADIIAMIEREFRLSFIRFSAGGGIIYNVSQTAEGRLPDPGSNDGYIKSSAAMKKSSGLSVAGSVEAGFSMNSPVEPFMRLQYEQNINDIIGDYQISSHPERIKIMAGVRIRIIKQDMRQRIER